MRLGITTPVLSMVPGVHAPWEVDGTIDDVAAIATAAERLGYDHLTCSEHVVVPTDVAAVRGSRYWDPLATFGYLAAVTSRIRLATNVLVLGYHHPLEIAKRYGTLDQVSGGRLILGARGRLPRRRSSSSCGCPFDDRGPRADDALLGPPGLALRAPARVLRAPTTATRTWSWTRAPARPSVPLWIGGRTGRSLRRAVELGDGWVPFGIRAVDVAAMLAEARDTPAWARTHRGRSRWCSATAGRSTRSATRTAPGGSSTGWSRRAPPACSCGSPTTRSAHYLEQLEAMAQLLGRRRFQRRR